MPSPEFIEVSSFLITFGPSGEYSVPKPWQLRLTRETLAVISSKLHVITMSIFNFQYGTFEETSPSWFDWLSLLVSALSIILAYAVARWIYNKEKRDKQKEDLSLKKSTKFLFESSLNQLETAISNQLDSLRIYNTERDFKFTFHPEVQVDFLQFINLKDVYEEIGYNNSAKIDSLNHLMTNLYRLYDFREAIRGEVRAYLEKYAFFENKFYSYRKVLHTKYFHLCNMRAVEFTFENGLKRFRFHDDDLFMKEYSDLRNKILTDENIVYENGLRDRKLFSKGFLLPLINDVTHKFIPEDMNAIEVNDIANESYSAFLDMESITDKHFSMIAHYITNLELTRDNISSYLN